MVPRPRASTCGATHPSTLANAQKAWNSGQHVRSRLVLGLSMLPARPISGDDTVLAGSSVPWRRCLLMPKRAGRLESGSGSERRKSRSQPWIGRGDSRTHTPLNALKGGVSAPFGTIETDETKTREVRFCERANRPPPSTQPRSVRVGYARCTAHHLTLAALRNTVFLPLVRRSEGWLL